MGLVPCLSKLFHTLFQVCLADLFPYSSYSLPYHPSPCTRELQLPSANLSGLYRHSNIPYTPSSTTPTYLHPQSITSHSLSHPLQAFSLSSTSSLLFLYLPHLFPIVFLHILPFQ